MTLKGKKLSTWNYRVVKRTYIYPDGETEDTYGIHECHYEPTGWTKDPVAVEAESPEALREVLQRMLLALDIEVIDGGKLSAFSDPETAENYKRLSGESNE